MLGGGLSSPWKTLSPKTFYENNRRYTPLAKLPYYNRIDGPVTGASSPVVTSK